MDVVETTTSTNTELAAAVAADPDAWPAPSLLVAEHQESGRGRTGRQWSAPPRSALLGSLLLRPDVPPEALSWLPLLAGLATAHGLRATAGVQAVVKWPNDVLVPVSSDQQTDDGQAEDGQPEDLPGWGRYRKVAGILAEVVPGGVIVGVGLNVLQTTDELAVPSATSLALCGGATTDREVLLTALSESFLDVIVRWQDAGGDALGAGLVDECVEVCVTLGERVRVDLAGGSSVEGLAVALAPDGGLVVRDDAGSEQVLRSGDVRHLRLGALN
ncbi:biotin--[acetyl-CoA-carboxylase] ligase [Oerskovia flava]|uniref:biotin--[acetyl-CoA-carboxylase] ligase n=1 Tax=Oerskovia flava TaxID=2986422 RepID=UPI0022403F65|nr:biotin--[acetyl-CoA-carboxylase] ligase [Oerskovia sp. JB1-3-2]